MIVYADSDQLPLLSLELPSCMVVPAKNLENKSLFFTPIMHSQHNLQLLTVYSTNYIEMDNIFSEKAPDNYNEVRDRTALPKSQMLRDLLISSTKSSVVYHERIESNNTTIENVNMNNKSPGLSYKMTQEKAI